MLHEHVQDSKPVHLPFWQKLHEFGIFWNDLSFIVLSQLSWAIVGSTEDIIVGGNKQENGLWLKFACERHASWPSMFESFRSGEATQAFVHSRRRKGSGEWENCGIRSIQQFA